MRPGSIFFGALGIEAEVTYIQLHGGAFKIHGRIHGPARMPAGVHQAAVYGEDGLQVVVIVAQLEEEMTLSRGQTLDVLGTLQVGEVTQVPTDPTHP